MDTRDDVIRQLMVALEGVLKAENAEGDRLLSEEHREPINNSVFMVVCRVCGEPDGHEDECVVAMAERALRSVQGAQSRARGD